ncbi:MAG: site-specific DNA-methyltransferase [Candidatus Thiodiazotropha taylori]|nr:site-specific DNA-methyltransferase [Candidatus Thiodiazotropha taylori]
MNHKLLIKYVKPGSLNPYVGNSRAHSKQQIQQIAKSIQAFGFINPILVDDEGGVIAGHGRLLASQKLGLVEVPVISIKHLTESKKRAYILADNKLADNAGWDNDLLRVELGELSRIDLDLNIELTGFSSPEIDVLLDSSDSEHQPYEDTPPDPPSADQAVSSPGDLWQMGPHRLICGDCRDQETVDRLMDGDMARMVLTDPPYNVPINGHVCGKGRYQHQNFAMASGELSTPEFDIFLIKSLNQLARVSCSGALHYVFMDWRHMGALLQAGDSVYDKLINLCVWSKTNGGMGSFYRSQHELVFVFKQGNDSHFNGIELGRHGRYRTNVWTYAGINSFGNDRDKLLAMHPTVKPIPLLADAIQDASKRGEIVLDGFTGSGSTLMAAEQTGRAFRGIEIDPRYIDVTLRRWMENAGDPPIHLESGQTFSKRVDFRARSTSREVIR